MMTSTSSSNKLPTRKVEFFDSYPFAEFRKQVLHLSQGADRCEIAAAFMTGPGCELVRELRDSANIGVNVVVSVNFPTDLKAICRLSQSKNIRVWLHTGYQEPNDKRERGQFHSKLVSFYYPDGKQVVIVGSHNWTGFALDGINLEASMIVDTVQSDDLAISARDHFRECLIRSHPFDDSRVLFYEAIQRKLHLSPSSLEPIHVPGFENFEAVVIHAESPTPEAMPTSFRLYIPATAIEGEFFPRPQPVALFVHNMNFLKARMPVVQKIRMYTGVVTMNNSAIDAPVQQRDVEYELTDLKQPRLNRLNGNIPAIRNEVVQIVVRFEDRGLVDLPIFHSAGSSPSLKPGKLQVREIDRDEPIRDNAQLIDHLPLVANQMEDAVGTAAPSRYMSPQELFFQVTLKLPASWLYSTEVATQILSLLYGRRLVPETESPDIKIELPDQKHLLSDFVYRVNYQLTKESLSESATQTSFHFR